MRLRTAYALPALILGFAVCRAAEVPLTAQFVSVVEPGKWRAGGMLVSLSNGDTTNLSYQAGSHVLPRISPDGRTVLFNSYEGGALGVWLGELDGNTRRICDGEQAEWSPDGTRIVLARSGRIVEHELATGRERCTSPETWTDCRLPSYLPGGAGVLFVKGGEGRAELVLVPPNGNPRALASADVASTPRGAPDGAQVAFQDGAHIHLLDIRTGTRRQITTAGGVQRWPMWSADGKYLAYWQASYDSPKCDVHAIEPARPDSACRIQRNVSVGAGWNGAVADAGRPQKVRSVRLAAWHGKWAGHTEPGSFDFQTAAGWTSLPEGAEPGKVLEHDLGVETDWGIFLLAHGRDGLWFAPKTDDGRLAPLQIVPTDARGEPCSAIRSIRVARYGPDELTAELSCAFARGETATCRFSVPRTLPAVRVVSPEPGGVLVKAAMRHLVLPDTRGDDLILDAASAPGAGPRPLPAARSVLGSPGSWEGNAFLMVAAATPVTAAALPAPDNPGQRTFRGVWIPVRDTGACVAVVAAPHVWATDGVAANALAAEKPTLSWKAPFDGIWRIVLRGEQALAAETADIQRRRSFKPDTLKALAAAMPQDVSGSVIYACARSEETPLDTVLPPDILRDVFGPSPPDRIGSRHAQERLLMNILRYSGWREAMPGKTGWPVPMMNLLIADTTTLLAQYDEGIAQYRQMMARLDALADAATAETGGAAFAAALRTELDDIKRRMLGKPERTPEQVRQAGEAVVRHMETPAFVKEGRNVKSDAVRSFRKLFKLFDTAATQARHERWELLARLEQAARRIRNLAGLHLLREPGCRATAEQARELAYAALRHEFWTTEIYYDPKQVQWRDKPFQE
ncbi:MAG: PD40 domain-containing protein [Kiritimatiellae bacterium]|nr:PD40 domain-containing protein [Kiritimatiellia bacterium]